MVRLTDHPNMTLDVYCGRKTTIQQQQKQHKNVDSSSKIDVVPVVKSIVSLTNSLRDLG